MNVRTWARQSTTGAGVATLFACLGAVASGSMTWTQAIPLLVGGIVGVLWPENENLGTSAASTVASVEQLVIAYRAGLLHGGAPPKAMVSEANSGLHGSVTP